MIDAAFGSAFWDRVAVEAEGPRLDGERLLVTPRLLTEVAREAFRSVSYYVRRSHLEKLVAVLDRRDVSENDRFVTEYLLRNAVVASRGKLPLCQDTGTAIVYGWKSESVRTGVHDHRSLDEGAAQAYCRYNLRSSHVAPLSFFSDRDTGDNTPSQIHIDAVADPADGPEYRFSFIAKGGGSANKTALFQMTPAILEATAFEQFLREKLRALGSAACPPYRLAIVVGGTSAEENLRVLKLASTELLDLAPTKADGDSSSIYRDEYWEQRTMDIARETGIGAQFGGSSFAIDARVIRLARHAASCPISIGVSCVAHRNMLARINAGGVFFETLERDPEKLLRERGGRIAALLDSKQDDTALPLDLDRPMLDLLKTLRTRKVGDRLLLSGTLIVARDAAHARWRRIIAAGDRLPAYLATHPILYAGPAATPEGAVIGSFGPTTAQRMDEYADELMSNKVALVTIAKGNRSSSWINACKKYGGFYLGTIGGAAALIAERHIVSNEVIDYPDLGMEAVRKITVSRLPAFIVTDDRGNDLYADPAGLAR